MQTALSNLFESHTELVQTRATFEEFGFVGIRNSATMALAQSLYAETQERIDRPRRAVRADALLQYSAGIVMLGPQARSFLEGPALSDSLPALTGERFVLTDDMSCITVYAPGDVLGAHLDQPAERCALTCILYLSCSPTNVVSQETGLQLRVYGEHQDSIKQAPRMIVPTQIGRLVFGRGARIWHERPKLQPQETVVALTACFGAA